MPQEVSLRELVSTGAHFGHQVKRWNPKIKPYIYGQKQGIHIFDLIKTKRLLEEALNLINKRSSEGKKILLVGTKKQVRDKIKEIGKETNCFYVSKRWLGGILTNFDQIKKSMDKFLKLKSDMESDKFASYTKREKLLIQREIDKLEEVFGGIVGMDTLPDLLFIVDIGRERVAVKEANEKGIETVAIVDSNSDPTLVDYPIPMNDDAGKALEYVLNLVKEAILLGKKKDKNKTKFKNP